MDGLIGSWKAKVTVGVQTNIEAFSIPAGAIVTVVNEDLRAGKVLIEFGPRTISWQSKRFLNNFEKLS